MKHKLLSVALLAVVSFSFAQEKNSLWNTSTKSNVVLLESKMQLPQKSLYDLKVNDLKNLINQSPQRNNLNIKSNIIISMPNADGEFERFGIYENAIMDPALAAQYPEIKSYIGIGIDNSSTSVYFSISPLGFKSMTLYADKSPVFIEPYSQDLKTYSVYKKSDKKQAFSAFECSMIDEITPEIDSSLLRPNADDAKLRTFRLAMSVTGEYTTYFGGTKALALAAINNTMTRVNAIFEKDFAVRMVLVANNDAVIYTNASTDPYSASSSMSNWNAQLQSTLTSVIGEANYDVGHLFGASGGGGNAGCIGCVCVNGSKGSAYTSPGDGVPSGDKFDVDYVAHEFGHQFGANHTFTHSNEGTGVQMEPGSGSTIMGYAGITSLDVQANSDAYFHAVSIQQITNNIKTKTCPTAINTGNAIPTASAGLDYTIPKSTPFKLTGIGTDANGDALTYNWEQMDSQTTAAVPSATKTTGVNFRSYNSTTTPERYFPKMSSVLTGATTTAGSELTVEALSSVARTLNFRFTVRDNRAGGSGNNSDDMIVTVNATAGPFTVSSPNTTVSYVGGSAQTVTWSVAGTTTNGVNCASVDILISTNAGTTWSTLIASTPNDGSQAVTIPNIAGTQNRIMVKGTNHIFFDVSNTNFTITAGSVGDTIAPTAPTLSASGTTQTTTNLSWSGATDNVGVTGYDVFRGATLLVSTASTSYAVTGLTASTAYTFSVKTKDAAGNISVSSNTVSITTLANTGDTTAPSTPTSLTASGTTQTTTTLKWTASTDNVGVTGYDIYSGASLLGNVAGTSANITGLVASTSYTFSVKAKDAAGNTSASSNIVSVTTLSNTLTYCASQGNSTADEKTGKVVFGTINNTSTGTAGYESFTSLSTNVNKSSAYTITITPSWTSTKYSEGYAVFVDYNQDGDFADAGETVWTKTASTTTPVSGSITIPATALSGSTRMRVAMKYNGVPTSCEAFSFGQVEDYTIVIGGTGKEIVSSSTESNAIDIKLYPNPTSSQLNISTISDNTSVKIYNMLGQTVYNGQVRNNSLDVSNLPIGTYMLEIDYNNSKVTKRFIKQ